MTKAIEVPNTSPPLRVEFDYNRLCDVEQATGINAFEMTDAVLRNFVTFRAIFRFGLMQHNPVENDEAAGAIIGAAGVKAATQAVADALKIAVAGSK